MKNDISAAKLYSQHFLKIVRLSNQNKKSNLKAVRKGLHKATHLISSKPFKHPDSPDMYWFASYE